MKPIYKYILGLIAAVVTPLIFNGIGLYWLHLLGVIAFLGILAVSFDLAFGITGLANLAHTALCGIGAYLSANLLIRLGFNFWLTIPVAGIAAALVAGVLGFMTLKLKGMYYGLTTFAFLQIMGVVFLAARSLTGGAQGLSSPPIAIFGRELSPGTKFAYMVWAYIMIALLFVALFAVDRIVHSRTGRALIGIREDDLLASAVGINLFKYRMVAVCVAGLIAGIAGALFASFSGTIVTGDFGLPTMAMLLAACLIGGSGTIVGPAIGALIVVFLPEILRPIIGNYYYAAFGVLLIISAVYFPNGVLGVLLSTRTKAFLAKHKPANTR